MGVIIEEYEYFILTKKDDIYILMHDTSLFLFSNSEKLISHATGFYHANFLW